MHNGCYSLVLVDIGSILWKAFFPLLFQLVFKSWHGFNPYQISIFFPITLFFSFFPSCFCPPLISSSPFPLPSFLHSCSYSLSIPFLSFSSSCFLFFFTFLLLFSPFCCFSFSLYSLSFNLLISSSFSPPLSFSLFLFFLSRP